jgi:predicted permease
MKVIKWIGHPVVLICAYLLFITEGENFGGFYMVYLMLALPHGVPYAVLAALGIACVVLGFNFNKNLIYWIKPLLYLIGLILMVSSLINFFATGDQSGTFQEKVPLATFVIVCVCFFCFFLSALSLFQNPRSKTVATIP